MLNNGGCDEYQIHMSHQSVKAICQNALKSNRGYGNKNKRANSLMVFCVIYVNADNQKKDTEQNGVPIMCAKTVEYKFIYIYLSFYSSEK